MDKIKRKSFNATKSFLMKIFSGRQSSTRKVSMAMANNPWFTSANCFSIVEAIFCDLWCICLLCSRRISHFINDDPSSPQKLPLKVLTSEFWWVGKCCWFIAIAYPLIITAAITNIDKCDTFRISRGNICVSFNFAADRGERIVSTERCFELLKIKLSTQRSSC